MDLDLSPLWLSLKIAGLATSLTFVLGIAAARWLLNYQGRWRGLIDGMLITPLVLPPTVVGFLLLALLGRYSPLGSLLENFDIQLIFNTQAAVISATIVAFPLMYRTTLGSFEQIDPTLLGAARTLGVSEWVVFWRVMLPQAYRGILGGTILSFARALGEFGATLMLAGNIPGRTQTMPIAIFFVAESGNLSEALIWVIILLLISSSVIYLLNLSSLPSGRSDAKGKSMLKSAAVIQKDPLSLPLSQNREQYGQQSSQQNTEQPQLVVRIQKHLANFDLNIQFHIHPADYSGSDSDSNLSSAQLPPLLALGILGASGSGKSMILRCIAGLENPDQGEILLNGRQLWASHPPVNLPSYQRRIGIVFQNYALFSHLTVWQNIAFGLYRLSQVEQSAQITPWIHRLDLQGLETLFPHQLSGGQQQRVALARAMVLQPEVLLLDEPFAALDTHLRSRVEQQLRQALADYRGIVIWVSHHLEELYRLCRRLLVVDGGQVLAQAARQAIFQNPGSEQVARLTGCKNISPVLVFSDHEVLAEAWGCKLHLDQPLSSAVTGIGIHAHHLNFVTPGVAINSFPCWLATSIESPHEITLYLKLFAPARDADDFALTLEIDKKTWQSRQSLPWPWWVQLDAIHLMPLYRDP